MKAIILNFSEFSTTSQAITSNQHKLTLDSVILGSIGMVNNGGKAGIYCLKT
jgi:hypothetical protein